MKDTFSVQAPASGPPPDLDWNLLVTSMEHHARDVRRALRPLVALRPSPFRNVLLARVDDPEAVLAAVDALATRRPALHAWLGKMVPVARTFAVDPERFASQVEEMIAPLLGEVGTRSFHVRIERRGHKGRIDSHAVERAVGEWMIAELAARETPGRVDFDDPDVVVAVEVVESAAGIAMIPRALRQAHRFVHVD